MKGLVQFIKESLLNEASVIRYLINNFDSTDDETLKSAKEFWQSSKQMQKAVSLDDLEKIYDYRDKHTKESQIKSRPEPLVANYGNKEGSFAFRRWVKNVPGIKINGNANSLFHDTNLKGNGAWTPTAQDMEDVISVAYNNVNHINKVAEAQDKAELIIQYYQDNKEVFDKIASKITSGNSPLSKLQTKGIKASPEWVKLGQYSSEGAVNKTPKTDIISADRKLKISLKEEGGSQLMSGGYNEARATMLTALDKSGIKSDDANELRTALEEKWMTGFKSPDGIASIKKNPNHPEYNTVKNAETAVENVKMLLNKLIKENPKFEDALLYEAMTGEEKFGKDSPAAANCVLVWNENKPESSMFYTIEEYIEHLKKGKIQYLINFKSANNRSWQNLRIVCGNAKSTDSEKVEIEAI